VSEGEAQRFFKERAVAHDAHGIAHSSRGWRHWNRNERSSSDVSISRLALLSSLLDHFHYSHSTWLVEIHALWGYLLALFALFRFLTYFFLYLRPPASILPSRPPTEALASLFLTCGGVVFVFSTEQITFAAMRHQADDVMVSSA